MHHSLVLQLVQLGTVIVIVYKSQCSRCLFYTIIDIFSTTVLMVKTHL